MDFLGPVRAVAGRHPTVPWTTVPETPVNKEREPLLVEDKIRPAKY
jgi:hypothetical protein